MKSPCPPQALSSHLRAWIPFVQASLASPSWTPSFRVCSSGCLVAGLCAALLRCWAGQRTLSVLQLLGGAFEKQSAIRKNNLNRSRGLLLANLSSVPYCVNGENGFLALRCILQVQFCSFSFGAVRIQRVHRERRMTGSTAVFPSWNPLNPLKGR